MKCNCKEWFKKRKVNFILIASTLAIGFVLIKFANIRPCILMKIGWGIMAFGLILGLIQFLYKKLK